MLLKCCSSKRKILVGDADTLANKTVNFQLKNDTFPLKNGIFPKWCLLLLSVFCDFRRFLTTWTKCGLSNNGDRTSVTSRNNTQDGMESMHGWCALPFSLSWLDTDGYPRACCDTSLVEYALSLCGVTSRDTRRASRASFSGPYHNQRVELKLCGQRVKQQHKEKLGLEQHFRATDFLP